jgi:hypothetical protein
MALLPRIVVRGKVSKNRAITGAFGGASFSSNYCANFA